MCKEDGAAVSATIIIPSPNTSGSAKQGSRWARYHHHMSEAVENIFYHLGYWVATHPKLTLLISMMLVVACCSGFVNFKIKNKYEDLWVPSDSLSKKQEKIVQSYFNDSSDYAVLLIDSPVEGGSILTKEAMDTLWELNSLVLEIETNGNIYVDLCPKQSDGVTCEYSSRAFTRFWGDSFEAYNASVMSDADVLESINVGTYPDGASVNLEVVFGNTLEYDSAGSVMGATAMIQMYIINTNTDEAGDDSNNWMADFQDFMEEQSEEYTSIFGIEYITTRSLGDALEESTNGEAFLYVITCMIIISFVMVAIGRCRSGSLRRRTWLGPAGVFHVMAAGLAAYGLNSAFGVPFTALSIILPFILVGIGADEMFVVMAAFDHTAPDLPVVERVALGLKRCGVSITYTSMTNFFAFMLGSTTSLPAVEYLCCYAGTAILFDFLLQVTAFVALLTIDANRQEAGRLDCCCCLMSKTFLEEDSIPRGVLVHPGKGSMGGAGKAQHGLRSEVYQLGPVGRFLKEQYTPLLLSTPGKAIVLLGTTALLVAGIYGTTQTTQGFDILDLAPDDHYARDYTTLAREYDLDISSQFVSLGIYTLEVDYTDVEVQAQIQEANALIKEQQYMSGPIDSWLSSCLEWAAKRTEYSVNISTSGGYPVYNNPDTFYTLLAEFLEEEDYEQFEDDIVFKSDGSIEISRSWLFLVNIVNTEENMDALLDTRNVIDQSSLDSEVFGFSSVFVFTEQFLMIYEELILHLILVLVTVMVLSLLILGNVAVVVLVCFTVVIIDIDLLGFVYYWGLGINNITVIELIMAVGLVVDYMVHIVHFFLHQDLNIPKDTRIADALGKIGPSGMVGATTTLLGIMPLAFASKMIFRIFFKIFVIIISFGVFHGTAFIPVVLSFLPDCWIAQSRGRADNCETKETPPTGAGLA